MQEPANINTTTVQPALTATVYGMPAYAIVLRPWVKCMRARIS